MTDLVKVAHLEGEYDIVRSSELRASLCELLGAEMAVVDCSGVTYFDSIGVAELVNVYKQIRRNNDAGRPRLVVTSAPLRRLLSVAGIDRLFELHDTLEAALAPAPS